MEGKKKEDYQSRREFFKNAAKSALPILGAIVLSNIALPSQAAKMGCEGTCSGYCTGGCSGCSGGCSGSCSGRCTGGCTGGCTGCTGCSSSCSGTSSRG